MYCPHCGAPNDERNRFCRECGVRLGDVQLALTGRIDDAMKRYSKSVDWFICSLISIGIAIVNALTAIFFSSDPTPFAIGLYLIAGLALALPMAVMGLVRLDEAQKIVKEERRAPDLGELERPAPRALDSPATALHADVAPHEPESVVEHTTRRLDRS